MLGMPSIVVEVEHGQPWGWRDDKMGARATGSSCRAVRATARTTEQNVNEHGACAMWRSADVGGRFAVRAASLRVVACARISRRGV